MSERDDDHFDLDEEFLDGAAEEDHDYDRIIDRVDRGTKPKAGVKKGRAAWSKLEDVLAEPVEGHEAPGGDELAGGAHGVGFSRTGDVNTEAFRLAENGDGEGERVERYVGEGGEAAVVDLLLAAAEVELDDFYEVGVFEVGHGRIVESDVAIFANAQADEIDGFFLEEGGVLGGDGGGIGLFGGEGVEPRDGDVAQEVLLKVVTKTLWVGGGQADVVVHVKRGNLRPIERVSALGGINEGRQKFILRWRAGKNNPRGTLLGYDRL